MENDQCYHIEEARKKNAHMCVCPLLSIVYFKTRTKTLNHNITIVKENSNS